MRTTDHTPVPGAATPAQHGGPHNGAELRSIVAKALNMRRTIQHAKAGHRGGPELWMSAARLQQWLDRNPYPSPGTVRSFPLYADLALVMPGTAGGRSLLNRARVLML